MLQQFGQETKYLKWYFNILEKYGKNIRDNPFMEAHHVYPKFLFGQNKNLKYVSFRIHFILHALLWKHFKSIDHKVKNKAAYPLIRMKSLQKNQFKYDSSITSSLFAIAKFAAKQSTIGENNPFFKKKHTAETKEKISKANKGKKLTESCKKLISESQKKLWNNEKFKTERISMLRSYTVGRIVSNETRQKLSNVHKGKTLSDETKIRISNALLGKTKDIAKTDIHRKHISEGLKGKRKTSEHINKINKNPEKIKKTAEKHKGMKRGDETKRRMSEAKKNFKPSNTNKKAFYDPNDLLNVKYFLTGEQPKDWLPGDPRMRRTK